MSQSDTFIAEVTEEVRRERLFKFFRRYGGVVLVIIVVLVAGAIWYEVSRGQRESARQELGDSLIAALDGPEENRLAALSALPPAEGGAKAVAAYLLADALVKSGDTAEAIAALDAVSGDSSIPALYRDLATFKSAVVGVGVTDPNMRRTMLEGLTAQGGSFAPLAREQLALIDLETGNIEASRTALQAVLDDAMTTSAQRSRIEALLEALGSPADQ
ncbi:hypothetical protein BVG79_01212 [Ketogulonicigenium robustum]|uniref:Ancillary SecYEG translocon subunit/Cell division coordinator CpoB TPR domain-containing protein n=1 Tax=Ketogulonicigenium robustum TaxID=92947 RepID=A0A1W6NZ78_9RHOB|nr:tetratricopeptide repeat protein [Ketogulonicigenium robustum]ARO14558.1 hypothetical protein BVG79_01212 [Ketogulonicigenium robustum]